MRTQRRQQDALVLGMMGLALGLRVWGIGFGLPYDLTPDEPHHIFQAFRLGAGESGPLLSYWHTVGKGGLDYLLFFEYGLLYVVWQTMGWIANTREFALLYFKDPTVFYLTGRLTVALMGTLTCFVVFLVGKRLYGFWVGLGSALIGATAYSHVAHSHLINVHVGTALALWASILAYLYYDHKKDRRWLIGAGMIAGVAISFAYTGVIVVLALLLAIGLNPETRQSPGAALGKAAVLLASTLVAVIALAPELMLSLGSLYKNFSQILGQGTAFTGAQELSLREAIDSITILRRQDWMEYVRFLINPYNALLTFSALLGAGIGLYQMDRWSVICTVVVGIFLMIVSASDRGAGDRYLLPVMPCLWLLSSRAIAMVAGHRLWLTATGLLCVAAPSLVLSVHYDYELTQPDTRIVAKQWIEANIPSGAKILMDGMRFRFVQSPPLNPNRETVARRVTQVGDSELRASQLTLALYSEAMEAVKEPTYDLHSTVYGLQVEDLSYYIANCFDYIVTSSDNTKRHLNAGNQERFPKSARFYEQLQVDAKFRVVYSVAAIPWRRTGPVITVYKVPQCSTSARRVSGS